jgi:hypothetical protein
MMRVRQAMMVLAVVMFFGSGQALAQAQVQTQGSEQLGRVWIGVHPLGGSAFFDNESSIYKLGFNVLGKIANAGKLTFWLGGELNVGGVSNYVLIEPGIVFQITFEKLIKIPLVPHVRFGLSGGIDDYYGSGVCTAPGVPPFPCNDFNQVAGDFWAKFGGGVHYFIIRQIGLGIETNFGLGGQFFDQNNVRHSAFRGYFDFLAGAVFSL